MSKRKVSYNNNKKLFFLLLDLCAGEPSQEEGVHGLPGAQDGLPARRAVSLQGALPGAGGAERRAPGAAQEDAAATAAAEATGV